MKVRVKVPPSPFRLLKERYFGEETRNPRVARAALARLAPQLPPDVLPIVSAAVHSLIDYQDPDYALAYLERIERYIAPATHHVPNLGELAQLLSDRMHFEDPIRIAQLELAKVDGMPAEASHRSVDRLEKFRWDEVIAMFPPKVAAPALDLFRRMHLAKLTRRNVTIRYSSKTPFKLRRLKWLAAARITRPFSERFKLERVWVERWLHMIDRSLVKHPDATAAVVQTATLIKGHGDIYQNGLAHWNAIINGIVKPTCDGDLPLRSLREAIEQVRDRNAEGLVQAGLLDMVEELRRQALAR